MKRKITGILLAVILAVICVSAYADSKVTWNGHTYQVCMDNCTWKEANEKCISAGGHLVTITSAEENKFIQKQIKKHSGHVFWMGLRQDSKGKWSWVTKEKVSYTNWAEGQPDGEYSATYGTIYTTGHEDWNIKAGQWDDCNDDWDEVCYICEWEKTPVESIKLNKSKATLKKGKTLQLSIKKIKPADATDTRVKWKSSDKSVAKVDKNGKVKAVGKGTCIITCTAQDGSNVSAEVKIKVK